MSALEVAGSLASLGQGFVQPVHDAQQVFRRLLDAMSHPGRVQTLGTAVAGLQTPPTLAPGQRVGVAMTAALLTLLDAETPVHLADDLASPAAAAYLRFHCGAALAAPAVAPIIGVRDAQVSETLLQVLPLGSDTEPQLGATLLIEVAGLDEQPLNGALLLALRGPGIAERQSLAVVGLPLEFWRWRQRLQRDYPCGVDLLLCCGARLAAIPRSTMLTLEG